MEEFGRSWKKLEEVVKDWKRLGKKVKKKLVEVGRIWKKLVECGKVCEKSVDILEQIAVLTDRVTMQWPGGRVLTATEPVTLT